MEIYIDKVTGAVGVVSNLTYLIIPIEDIPLNKIVKDAILKFKETELNSN